jgi:signal transduction histidine kinase
MSQAPNDEIGQLSRHFNLFMEKLETYHNNLQLEISERRRLERELLNVSEREKQKFGRILHDDLGPHLIGTEVLSKVLKEKLSRRPESAEAAVSAEKIRELIAEAVSKTRNLARGLMPVEAAVYGLEASLEDMAENVSRIYGVDCGFSSAEAVTLGDNTAATHIYYIVHEAVHNAVKHGDARRIKVSLKHEGPVLTVKIVDDGRGLPDNPNPKGMGLSILKYRADCLGAELNIENQAGAGVMVELRLPAANLFGQGDLS